jgi:hypothetical protein
LLTFPHNNIMEFLIFKALENPIRLRRWMLKVGTYSANNYSKDLYIYTYIRIV